MAPNQIVIDAVEPRKLSGGCDTSCFCCGYEPVDEFIRKEAKYFQNERLGITYLWYHRNQLVGMVTLSMADLRKKRMLEEDRLTRGRENYPAVQIGQLGVEKDFQNNGIGSMIIKWCLGKAIKLSEEIGCRFLVLHSKETTIKWYEKRGFKLIPKQKARKQKIMFRNIIPYST